MDSVRPVSFNEAQIVAHADKLFFHAIELSTDPQQLTECINTFKNAIELYKNLADRGSAEIVEWCFTAIEESNQYIDKLTSGSHDQERQSVSGAIFRVACSLDLVSCVLMSKDFPQKVITDGSKDPVKLMINDEVQEEGDVPKAFLQITPEIAYPLGPGVPCLKAKVGYYILALPNKQYYGIIFPEGYPSQVLTMFEQELSRVCTLCSQDERGQFSPVLTSDSSTESDIDSWHVVSVEHPSEQKEAPQTVFHSLADSITSGASYVTWGIKSTSNLVKSGLETTATTISQGVGKTEEPVAVPGVVKSSVGFIKSVTPAAVYLSSGAASALTSIAYTLGSGIATGVGAILPETSMPPHLQGVVAVGAASVNAFASVWNELGEAGKNLIEGTQNASVKIVETRFGEEMGALTGDVIGIGKDVYQAHNNVTSIGIKSLAKGSVTAAGKVLILEHTKKIEEESKSKPTAALEANPSLPSISAPPQASSFSLIPQDSILRPSNLYSKLIGSQQGTQSNPSIESQAQSSNQPK